MPLKWSFEKIIKSLGEHIYSFFIFMPCLLVFSISFSSLLRLLKSSFFIHKSTNPLSLFLLNSLLLLFFWKGSFNPVGHRWILASPVRPVSLVYYKKACFRTLISHSIWNSHALAGLPVTCFDYCNLFPSLYLEWVLRSHLSSSRWVKAHLHCVPGFIIPKSELSSIALFIVHHSVRLW